MAMQTCGRSAPTPSAPSALTERSKPGLGQGPGLGALRHGNAVYRYMQEQSPVTIILLSKATSASPFPRIRYTLIYSLV